MSEPTAKQISFLLKLVSQKIVPGFDQTLPKEELDRLAAEVLAKSESWAHGATRAAVAKQIDRLIKMPAPVVASTEARNAAPSVVEAGFYLLDGDIVRVVESKAGKFYAKTLVVNTRRFEYAPGVVHKLSPESKLTRETAAKFGHEHDYCCFCQRDLSDPASVAKGYGPVCEKKYL